MRRYYGINGKIVAAEQAYLHVSDLGLLRAYGVFDFLRVHQGQPLFLNQHLQRFQHSAHLLGLTMAYSLERLAELIGELIAVNDLSELGLSIFLTGGYTDDGYTPTQPNLLILLRDFQPQQPIYYEKGAKLITYLYQRDLPEAKTTNYVTGIRLQPQLRQAGAIDVLYHDGQFISETARSNVFLVNKTGAIITPERNMLPGVTRQRVLDLAREDFVVEERAVSLAEFEQTQEVFITSTSKGVMPVVQIDHLVIGQGRPGEVTQRLQILLSESQEEYYKIKGGSKQ